MAFLEGLNLACESFYKCNILKRPNRPERYLKPLNSIKAIRSSRNDCQKVIGFNENVSGMVIFHRY